MTMIHIRTISNVEVVGVELQEEGTGTFLRHPLIVERVQLDGGEYFSFSPYVPFQLDEIFNFAEDIILTKNEVTSSILEVYYQSNLEAIQSRIEVMKITVDDVKTERRSKLQ